MKNWGALTQQEKEEIIFKYKKGKTGPELAVEHSVKYSSMRNTLHREHKKSDHGGPRQGSGNKKGVQFCSVCRKKIGNCEHTK